MAAPSGTTTYEGAFEYFNGILQRVALEEGQLIRSSNGTYTVHYYLKDHLGNVRQVISEAGTVLQQTEYFPTGFAISKGGSDPASNKYKYNGKEEQDLTKWFDYGARMYMSDIGRWNGVDAYPDYMGQEQFGTFTYVGGNPMSNIDPDGNWFFGLFGSTSEQRQNARAFAEETGGSVINYFSKNIGVRYDRPTVSNDENGQISEIGVARTTQYFRNDGKLDFGSVMANKVYDDEVRDWNFEQVQNGNRRSNGAVDFDPLTQLSLGSFAIAGINNVRVGVSMMTAAKGGYINLASSGRTAHIIAGDATGGGHAWFGSLKSFANGLTGSKSMFPATWSNSKIMHAVSDVAVNNQWIQQTGKAGAMFTKSGQPVRFVVEGTYQGTKMRVITTHTDIITAFPIK
jgi:RHS repeat-associated protein